MKRGLRMKTILKYASALVLLAELGCGQSPSQQATVTVAGKTISIKYSEPSVRGRQIFGEGGVVSHDKTYPVLLADASEVEVVLPQAPRAQIGGVEELLRGRDPGIGPQPDQPHTGHIPRIERVAPAVGSAHLHGQPDDLRQQDNQQHQEIPIAVEERIHGESSGRRELDRKQE